MSEITIVIEPYGIGHAAAAVKKGKIFDLMIDPSQEADRSLVGSIVTINTEKLVKGTNGYFVRLPDGSKGFIKGRKFLTRNKFVPVMVNANFEEHKALNVSEKLKLKSKYFIFTMGGVGINFSRKIRDQQISERVFKAVSQFLDQVPSDFGVVATSKCSIASDEDLSKAFEKQLEVLKTITDGEFRESKVLLRAPLSREFILDSYRLTKSNTIIESESAFDSFGLWEQIFDLLKSEVKLPNGGSIMIEPTSAFISVDINTGLDVSKSSGLRTNLMAMEELQRQLLARGLGGKIVIEFAPLSKLNRQKVENELLRYLREDPVGTILVGWTKLGNLELQRKKERIPLAEVLRNQENLVGYHGLI